MRQITENSVQAFNSNESFKSGNMEVELLPNVTVLKLHGNIIASKKGNKLSISTCGWNSVTTRERLNGLYGVNVYQKNHLLYLNGQEWDGKHIEIK